MLNVIALEAVHRAIEMDGIRRWKNHTRWHAMLRRDGNTHTFCHEIT